MDTILPIRVTHQLCSDQSECYNPGLCQKPTTDLIANLFIDEVAMRGNLRKINIGQRFLVENFDDANYPSNFMPIRKLVIENVVLFCFESSFINVDTPP